MGINNTMLNLLIIFLLTNCKNMREDKFPWLGTVSAPQEYPAEIYQGAIIADDFTYHFDCIWGTQNTGWGNEGGTMSVATEQMEIPHTLEFTWYSLVERKFYTGKWVLDKEKITQLFKEGFIGFNNNKPATYTAFIVGLAPKGRVVLWVNGAGNQREVGVFQAHDTIITKEMAYENAKYMFDGDLTDFIFNKTNYIKPETKEKIAKHGYPPAGIYDMYREKYNWKPNVILSEGSNLNTFSFRNYNGEKEYLFGEALRNDTYQKRAIPQFCGISWLNPEETKYRVWIDTFDEKEILEAFQKLGKEENIDLIIKIDADNTNSEINISNKKEKITIKNSKIRLSDKIK